jgi:hypothetical protein
LNAQKQHGDKTGLGYASKSKKKNNVPAPPSSLKKHIPNDICFDEDGNVFEEEGACEGSGWQCQEGNA